MPIWRLRKSSFARSLAAYRSQWKRGLARLFIPGYGKRGRGFWRDPKRAHYNFWYHRRTVSLKQLWRSGGAMHKSVSLFVIVLGTLCNIIALPADVVQTAVAVGKVNKTRKARAKRTTVNPSQSSRPKSSTRSAAAHSSSAYAPRSSGAYATSSDERMTREVNSLHQASRQSTSKATPTTSASPRSTPSPRPISAPSVAVPQASIPAEIKEPTRAPIQPPPAPMATTTPAEEEKIAVDPNAPKSKPRDAADRYSQKRLIIAGSSYCDKSALAELKIGSYLEFAAEPSNPHDKNAIMVLHCGQKVGYIAKHEQLPFVACLRLNRKFYGVLTDIVREPYPVKYEYEMWFEG
jgi:hypothetical protein